MNRGRLKRQNRRRVLQALYRQGLSTRVALAAETGLTKPTISSLVTEFLDEGLVAEQGLGRSSDQGGKRPTLLQFRNDSRQAIGVAIEGGQVVGVLADLAGNVSARHVVTASELTRDVADVIAGLQPQLDAPLLGIGVALPGTVDTASGVIRRSASLGLRDEPLGAALRERFGVPVWLANYAELSALGQLAFGSDDRPRTLVTISVDGHVELGVSQQYGAEHHGSELAAPMLEELGLDPAGLAALVAYPDWLQLRYESALGDEAAHAVLSELADRVGRLCAWTTLILGPQQISLAGGITDLGEDFLELLRLSIARRLGDGAELQLDLAWSVQLGPLGAVALVLQQELELLS